MSIIGVHMAGAEKSLLAKFEAVEKEGHVEYKHITLAGTDIWHYRGLGCKKRMLTEKVQFFLSAREKMCRFTFSMRLMKPAVKAAGFG